MSDTKTPEALYVYVIHDGEESHWVTAPSPGDALRIWIVDYCGMDGFDDAEITVKKLPDGHMLTVTSDDGSPMVKQPASEWAKEGAGLVGSTVQ